MRPSRSLAAIPFILLACLPLLSRSSSQAGTSDDKPLPPPGVYRVGNGVTSPHAIYAPDPEYTDKARKAKVNGTVIVSLIVTVEGEARDVKVTKSLTPDLDQRTIETVRTWRFKPGTKDGQPVAVQIEAEVSFHIR